MYILEWQIMWMLEPPWETLFQKVEFSKRVSWSLFMGLFQEDFYRVVSFLTSLGTKPEHRLLEWLQEDHSHPTPRVGGLAWTRRETNHKHRRTPQSPDRCSSEKKTDKARKSHCQRIFNTSCVAKSNLMFVIYNPPGVKDSSFNAWRRKRFFSPRYYYPQW